jgi:hypothetical protein
MTRRHSSNLSAISVVQIIFIVGLSAGQRENEKPEALKGFSDRVKGYIDLQKKAESGLPSFKETDQPAKIDAHKAALASAIRAARANARPDDIFKGASEQFRAIINQDARERSARDALAALREVPKLIAPRVNATYPEQAALATVPPLILKRLPLLPEGLEYRFMGRDLILRDVKSNLIVDFVRDAVPTIRK